MTHPFLITLLTCSRGLNPSTSPSILWLTRSSYFGTLPSWRLSRWGTHTRTSSSASFPCVTPSCQKKRTKVRDFAGGLVVKPPRF